MSFEQLALALKNRVCPGIFQARCGGSPPRPPASYAYALNIKWYLIKSLTKRTSYEVLKSNESLS